MQRTQTTIEPINDKFAWGSSEMGKIMFISHGKRDGFGNATKICKKAKKQLSDWTRTAHAKRRIASLAKTLGVADEDLIYVPNCGNATRGTYVHPMLLILIAEWCSADYSILIMNVMTERMEHQARLENETLKKDLDESRTEVSRLDAFLAESRQAYQEARDAHTRARSEAEEARRDAADKSKQIEELLAMGRTALGHNVALRDQNGILINKVDTVQEALHITQHRQTMPTENPKDENHLTIVRTGYPSDAALARYWWGDYKVIRCNKASLARALSTIKEMFPEMTIVYQIDYSPNSMMLWKNVLRKVGHRIKLRNCEFDIIDPNYTIRKLIRDIEKVHASRFQ